jgi:hypothetical protein
MKQREVTYLAFSFKPGLTTLCPGRTERQEEGTSLQQQRAACGVTYDGALCGWFYSARGRR